MNLSTTAVKTTAKTALKGHYLKSIIASVIYIFSVIVCLLCNNIFAYISIGFLYFVFLIAELIFIVIPLTLGFVYFTVRLIFGSDTEPVLIFKFFSSRKDYFRALRFSLSFIGNAIYSGFLLFLPSLFCDLIANGTVFKIFNSEIPLWVSSLWSVSAVLKVLAGIALITLMLKYYLAPFLIAADENMDPLEAMHMSKIVSTASKKDFLWLILSLIGYIIACLFVIPDIFIFPYFACCYCVHCRFAVAAYNRNVDKINLKDIPSFEVI